MSVTMRDLDRAKALQSDCLFAKYWLRNYDNGFGQDNCRKTANFLLRYHLWTPEQVMEYMTIQLPTNPYARGGCDFNWPENVRRVFRELGPRMSAPKEADPEVAKRFTSAIIKGLGSRMPFPFYPKQRKVTPDQIATVKAMEESALDAPPPF